MKFIEKNSQFKNSKIFKVSSHPIEIFLDFCSLLVSGILIYFQQLTKWVLPKEKKSLKGEVILITGSAGGLGKEICKQLATCGAKLVLWDVSSQANKETAQDLRNMGAEHVFEDTVDIADREQIMRAAEEVRRKVGHVTILVNNAGIAPVNHFLDLNPDAVRKTFEVNVISQFWTIQEFLPYMIENKSGHIVTIASTMSHMSMRGSAPYFATKHSVHGLIECLKDELASKGCTDVKFTTAYPFFIKTNLLGDSSLNLKFKFPSLTPFLEVSYVADKIVEGIQYEKEFVYIPRTFHLYLILKPFIPTSLHHAIVNFVVEECYIPSVTEDISLKKRMSVEATPPKNNNLAKEMVRTL